MEDIYSFVVSVDEVKDHPVLQDIVKQIKFCNRICGAHKFDHIFNKCGRFRVGFASSTKGFLSPVRVSAFGLNRLSLKGKEISGSGSGWAVGLGGRSS